MQNDMMADDGTNEPHRRFLNDIASQPKRTGVPGPGFTATLAGRQIADFLTSPVRLAWHYASTPASTRDAWSDRVHMLLAAAGNAYFAVMTVHALTAGAAGFGLFFAAGFGAVTFMLRSMESLDVYNDRKNGRMQEATGRMLRLNRLETLLLRSAREKLSGTASSVRIRVLDERLDMIAEHAPDEMKRAVGKARQILARHGM